jgi:response regulator RpfG family c-di-GMP phosphodiesterase
MTNQKKIPFLVVSSSPYLRGILKFVLESHLHTEVTELESEEKALLYLKNLDLRPSLIIYDYVPNAYLVEDFLIHLRETSKSVRIVVLVDKIRDEGRDLLKNIHQIKLLDEYELPANLMSEIKDCFTDPDFVNNEDFCRIDINFLSILDGINKNLFIRIGDSKFIRVFNEDETTDILDLNKYRAKGINYFYLKRDTSQWLLDQIQKQIDIFLKSNNFRFVLRGANESPVKKFEQKILRISDEVHIDKEFRDEIDSVVERIRACVEKEPKLDVFIKHLKENHDQALFFNHKMNLTSLISCVLAKNLEWISKTTMDKLVYASVVSDITLAVRPELLKFKNIQEFNLNKASFTPTEQMIFLNHPKDASNLIKTYFRSAPPDTDAIIYQHHEFPDGSGFPLGLKADKIPPLSALFILANDFSYYFLTDDEPSMDDFILKSHSRYDFVNFRKIVQALIKVRKKF